MAASAKSFGMMTMSLNTKSIGFDIMSGITTAKFQGEWFSFYRVNTPKHRPTHLHCDSDRNIRAARRRRGL